MIKVENRPRIVNGKTVDRWFAVGSSWRDPFWPTEDAAIEGLAEYEPAVEATEPPSDSKHVARSHTV